MYKWTQAELKTRHLPKDDTLVKIEKALKSLQTDLRDNSQFYYRRKHTNIITQVGEGTTSKNDTHS